MIKQLRVWLAVAVLGCGGGAPEGETGAADTASAPVEALPAHPDSAAIARFRSMLPDSVLARANACPFECCVYGDWVAGTTIPMHAAARATGHPAFTLAAGDSMKADSGVVYVTSIALVVVDDTVAYGPERARLMPGDTLVLLDPIGEGYWTAWRRGEILKEVPPFFESWSPEGPRGRLIGTPGREWWVRATARGRTGWFMPDRYRVTGADACS
jgi:hypothetical protein